MYSNKLFALCLKYAKNNAEAEDILQDSFIIIFDKIRQYKEQGSFEGWVKRITINVALQKYRRQTRLELVKDNDLQEETNLDVSTDIGTDYLLSLIQQLPDQYRIVFNLYVLDNYTHKEIAKMIGVSEGTSKSNLSRARSILKEEIIAYRKKQQEA